MGAPVRPNIPKSASERACLFLVCFSVVAFFNILHFTFYYFYCTDEAYTMSSHNDSVLASVSSLLYCGLFSQ